MTDWHYLDEMERNLRLHEQLGGGELESTISYKLSDMRILLNTMREIIKHSDEAHRQTQAMNTLWRVALVTAGAVLGFALGRL